MTAFFLETSIVQFSLQTQTKPVTDSDLNVPHSFTCHENIVREGRPL